MVSTVPLNKNKSSMRINIHRETLKPHTPCSQRLHSLGTGAAKAGVRIIAGSLQRLLFLALLHVPALLPAWHARVAAVARQLRLNELHRIFQQLKEVDNKCNPLHLPKTCLCLHCERSAYAPPLRLLFYIYLRRLLQTAPASDLARPPDSRLS